MAFNVTRPIPVKNKLAELNDPLITNYVKRLERTINEFQNIDRRVQRENLLHESKRYNEELDLNSKLTDQVLALENKVEALKKAINEHNELCRNSCDGKRRCGYEQYKRSCPDCPVDWMIEIE
jgi:hypothetical protein